MAKSTKSTPAPTIAQKPFILWLDGDEAGAELIFAFSTHEAVTEAADALGRNFDGHETVHIKPLDPAAFQRFLASQIRS